MRLIKISKNKTTHKKNQKSQFTFIQVHSQMENIACARMFFEKGLNGLGLCMNSNQSRGPDPDQVPYVFVLGYSKAHVVIG